MVASKIKRTLRLNEVLDHRVIEEARKIGISVNAYITMILTKELLNEKEG